MMKKNYLMVGALTGTLLLAGCSLTINGPGKSTEDSNKTSQSDSKGSNNSKSGQDNNSSSNNTGNEKSQNTSNVNKNSREYLAKIWLTARSDNHNIFDKDDHTYTPIDMSGEPLNPYNEKASELYPDGAIVLSPSYTYLGHVVFKDNNDGTVTFYDVPSHFQDHRWDEDDYSRSETAKILNNARTVDIANPSEDDIQEVASHITSATPQKPEHIDLSNNSNSSSEDNSNDESSGEKVTRANVIDKVEDYEGHKLDTSTYTYKEPEQKSNGDWGFSFVDKNGDLAGSYIVTADGNVTKYDENGDPE
ncbi:hypothetical protein [Staphylococcus petrasii]|nr:hypothetical protein [Staphylococcus petrasii]